MKRTGIDLDKLEKEELIEYIKAGHLVMLNQITLCDRLYDVIACNEALHEAEEALDSEYDKFGKLIDRLDSKTGCAVNN